MLKNGFGCIKGVGMSSFTTAVILAAGIGSRFGGETKKQYTPVSGVPCLARTVSAFEECSLIDEIILVGEPSEILPIIEGYGFKKITKTVPGGATRQDSALRGFDEISPKADFVAIHDGARCLITAENVESVVRAAYKSRAAAAAHKSEDTVKVSDDSDKIADTLDRDKIWLVQTPQVFSADVYRVCAYMAKKDGASVTDDCMLCERLGFKIKLVECGRNNIKLTSPDDLLLAEAIISAREGKKQ